MSDPLILVAPKTVFQLSGPRFLFPIKKEDLRKASYIQYNFTGDVEIYRSNGKKVKRPYLKFQINGGCIYFDQHYYIVFNNSSKKSSITLNISTEKKEILPPLKVDFKTSDSLVLKNTTEFFISNDNNRQKFVLNKKYWQKTQYGPLVIDLCTKITFKKRPNQISINPTLPFTYETIKTNKKTLLKKASQVKIANGKYQFTVQTNRNVSLKNLFRKVNFERNNLIAILIIRNIEKDSFPRVSLNKVIQKPYYSSRRMAVYRLDNINKQSALLNFPNECKNAWGELNLCKEDKSMKDEVHKYKLNTKNSLLGYQKKSNHLQIPHVQKQNYLAGY